MMLIKLEMHKRYLIDLTRLIWCMYKGRRFTGIDIVCIEYLRHFFNDGCGVFCVHKKCYVLRRKQSKKLFQMILEYVGKPSKIYMFRFYLRLLLSIDFSPKILGYYFISVGHSKLFGAEKFFKKYNLLPVVMYHDLIPLKFPEYNNSSVINFKRQLETNLRGANIIIANSQATANDLREYAMRNGYNMSQIICALLGADSKAVSADNEMCSDQTHRQRNKYFVILSTIEPRKNHIMLLNVWRRIFEITKNKDDVPNLFVIGRRGWRCSNVINMLEDCAVIKNYVFELNNCSDEEVQSYLQGACALLFPSFAEGYGLPLVEALQLKTPVIASSLDVFNELAGDIPEYLDPLDGLGWMRMIMEYAKPNSESRKQQLERMQGYHAPTWDEHFKIVDAALNL